MTVLATASRVLAWAADPGRQLGRPAAPPIGPAADASALLGPDQEVLDRIRQVAAQTAARLGAGTPPFGDAGRIGLGVLLIAAAVGCRRDPDAAGRLARAIPPLPLIGASGPGGNGDPRGHSPGWADATARHGVVGPFAASARHGAARPAEHDIAESLIGASPLTAILHRPPLADLRGGRRDEYLGAALGLLARPRGQPVVTCALAAPTTDSSVLGWRASLLAALARDQPPIALAVYLTALLRHGGDWDRLLDRAEHAPGRAAADAVLSFWAPLAAIDRKDPALLRAQPLLDGQYRRAIDLAGRFVTSTMSVVSQT